MTNRPLIAVALMAAFLVPGTSQAQGIVGGAQNGAAAGRNAAGPVGGVVGGVVGGAVGGAVGGVRGVLGAPRREHLPGYRAHHRTRRYR